MKLSLSWIFDHIDADWQSVSVEHITETFNQTVAEIEHVQSCVFDMQEFAIARIEELKDEGVTVSVPEWSETVDLGARDDISGGENNCGYLVIRDGDTIRWATVADFGIEKERLLPAFHIDEADFAGGWKANFEHVDVILTLDNKSITHRPDLWGHRGIAREIAGFLKLPLKPASSFLKSSTIRHAEQTLDPSEAVPIFLNNQSPEACSAFAVSSFEGANGPSDLFLASRLLKVGSRPISMLVDLTNYVMLDWSQPMHVYDADRVGGRTINIRFATKGETLVLLDGTELSLTSEDLVVADETKALALAGVMGGLADSVDESTTHVVLESATFDATTVRRSSARHHVRTEASARFEKSLDPNQAPEAIERFFHLAESLSLPIEHSGTISLVGVRPERPTIHLTHEFLEERAGFRLSDAAVVDPLERIGFEVAKELGEQEGEAVVYTVRIPTFRSSKDITIKEDLLEEVVRLNGFDRITSVSPKLTMQAHDLRPLRRKRALSDVLSSSFGMNEQRNYATFYEPFIQRIGYISETCLEFANPVAETEPHLIDSLVPGLLKNILENVRDNDDLRFYEWARVWHVHDGAAVEDKRLSGIWFSKRGATDFYTCKQYLEHLLHGISLRSRWEKVSEPIPFWAQGNKTAHVMVDDASLGFAGMVDTTLLGKLDALPESNAFVFDFDATVLTTHEVPAPHYKPLARYQATTFDVSALIPIRVTASDIKSVLADVDDLITTVELVDFFERDEWEAARSLSFRITLQHSERTLAGDEIEKVRVAVVAAIEKLGGELRS